MGLYLRNRVWWVSFRAGGQRFFVSTGEKEREVADSVAADIMLRGAKDVVPRSQRSARRARTQRERALSGISDGVGVVYAIAANGLVKFGYTKNTKRRIATLQTGSPVPLYVVAIRPGTRADERAAHARFAPHRVHGEWFRVSIDEARRWME